MRIGLALGGGGAKGLAHIPILETLDALGARPSVIAGTSIGAIIGALYATGLSGRELREALDAELFEDGERGAARGFDISKGFRTLLEVVDFDPGSGGFIRGEKVVAFLYEDLKVQAFEELEIPLKVVATDFWTREQVVFESGELLPALRASMSLPVLFSPVVMGERVLMDGGSVNPLPYDLLFDECDFTIAVDVSGSRTRGKDLVPSLSESIFNTFQIMSKAILDQKLAHRPPDLYLRPDIVDVQVLEFDKAHQIYEQAESSRAELERRLAPHLSRS